jgi:hypothetical protein
MRHRGTLVLACVACLACGHAAACDDARGPAPAGDAGALGTVTVSSSMRGLASALDAAASATGAPREGCTRSGTLEAIAADPSCLLDHVRDDVMREASARLALALVAEPPETTGGATSLLRLSLTNIASTDTLVVLEAVPSSTVAKADWTRIAGMPEVRPGTATGLLVPLAVTTLDAREHVVDATPMTPGTGTAAPRHLGVRLRPGAKLTHVQSWWALRIPAPYPQFKDDAGHVITPKTLPIPLDRGDYVVRMEVPLYGVTPAERTITTHVHVEPAPKSPKTHH